MKTINEKLYDLFKNDEEIFNETIEELDSYNGYLGDNRYYEMELLSEFYSGADPIEILNRAYFGYDETYNKDNREPFNPNREYFSYNGYGNLVSSDYKDYSCFLDEYFIDAVIENASNCYFPDEVTEILESE